MNFPILSSLILLPTIGALFILFIKSSNEKYQSIKYVALFISIANFLLSLYLWYIFDKSSVDFQFLENRKWLSGFINYKVGIDGISILFIILTTFITPICIISGINSVKFRLKEFLICILNGSSMYTKLLLLIVLLFHKILFNQTILFILFTSLFSNNITFCFSTFLRLFLPFFFIMSKS